MMYSKLPFEQYFIDQSLGHYGGKPRFEVAYKKVEFKKGYDGYYCVMFDKERDVYQIYFKETCTKMQWVSNFKFPSRYYDEFQWEGKDIQLKCATGWSEIYCSMKWYIRNEFKDLLKEHGKKPVEIIGWSLGSAIAQICAQDLFFNFNIRAHVFTFGSVKPWYGKSKDMREYLAQCYEEAWNFGDICDIVTYMVPLPRYFKFNNVKLKQCKFCLVKLFNPNKYHTEYWKSDYYKDLN